MRMRRALGAGAGGALGTPQWGSLPQRLNVLGRKAVASPPTGGAGDTGCPRPEALGHLRAVQIPAQNGGGAEGRQRLRVELPEVCGQGGQRPISGVSSLAFNAEGENAP